MKGSGEFMKACPYSASVEMAMCDMQIPYKLIQTHLLALEKEPWFVALHPKGKPSTPMLWSHGRWIFDTLPILDELMRRYPERQHHAVHVLKENCDARGTLRSGPMTKFAGSVDGSAEESQQRVALEKELDTVRAQLEAARAEALAAVKGSMTDLERQHAEQLEKEREWK